MGERLSEAPKSCIHFVGFRGEEYWSAVNVWGRPDYIHRGWDLRAQRELAPGGVVVFAFGSSVQAPRIRSFNDIRIIPAGRVALENDNARYACI